jgi:hypothetical protein
MMKYRIVGLLATLVGGICIATGQSSKAHSSSPKADPLTTATKPLTPKSALEQRHKAAVAAPRSTKSASKTSAELNRLEQQPTKATNKRSAASAKATSTPRSATADPAVANNSRTNFKYQKPAGGVQASRPNAHAANSTTPRVTKPN